MSASSPTDRFSLASRARFCAQFSLDDVPGKTRKQGLPPLASQLHTLSERPETVPPRGRVRDSRRVTFQNPVDRVRIGPRARTPQLGTFDRDPRLSLEESLPAAAAHSAVFFSRRRLALGKCLGPSCARDHDRCSTHVHNETPATGRAWLLSLL